MSRVAIIGSGITGLSLANLLYKKHDIVVLEKDHLGGLLKCEKINSQVFHTCGGHVYNSKIREVNNWFWNVFDKNTEFIKLNNKSAIYLNGVYLDYPIEKHIWQLSQEIQDKFKKDIPQIISNSKKQCNNFANFLKNKFGETLYNIYFRPYNEKIWQMDLSNIPLDWLFGKLPMPNINEIIECNQNHKPEQDFVHSTFYYPKKNGSQFIIDKLSRGLNIKYNYEIKSIVVQNNKVIINNEEFDKCIFTGNIKEIPKLIKNINLEKYTSFINGLRYHGTTSVFCELDCNPYTWIYLPSQKYKSHRIICTGNFLNNDKDRITGTIEFTNYISREQIIEQLKLMPFNPKYITHYYTQYSYPIQDKDTRENITKLKKLLINYNIYLCGRFSEWEYFNMDKCIHSAIKLSREL